MTDGADPRIAASYRRAIRRTGRQVIIRRLTGYAPAVQTLEAGVKARIEGFSSAPGEAYAGREQIPEGMRRVMLLAEDLVAQAFPLPLVDGDKLVIDGREADITDVDAETRRLGGAIQFNVTGVK